MENIISDLTEKFGAVRDERAVDLCAVIAAEKLPEAINFLKETAGYDVLIDIVGVDYLGMENYSGKRFAVIYCLKSTKNMARLRLKVQVGEGEKISTLSKIYPIADWQEREVWDQFGIVFEGHHNLRRILNHIDFEGHPLRKDYPAKKRQWLSANDKMLDQLEERLETLGYRVIEQEGR
ncbi:MAG: NADH-quinone oxidoreductase subunit C [Fibromonadaceae bacterium]|jgi:NADH-quinone oxidoreductase subunit C|nr:NADH-quinone oxidoreductase subunit C [Fibromonadaceae bacterium]